MITPRPLASLPKTELPWLSLRDHFVATVGASAGQGRPLGPLLVLADATFVPHSRFPLHPHKEMEILSVVLEGELSHHGNQAHGATLGPRSAQLISAREGITHAEGNDTDAPTHMLQLWFRPVVLGGPPEYHFRQIKGTGRELLAGDDTMPIRADVKVWWLSLGPGRPETVDVARGRTGYLLAMTAPAKVSPVDKGVNVLLQKGEGAEIGPGAFQVTADAPADVLWVDVPQTSR